MSELEFDCGWLNTPKDPGYRPEPVRFHIDGLLPTTGVVLLVGETNTGKSSWVLDLLFKLPGARFDRDDGAEGWWGVPSAFLALEGADYTREAWQSFVRDTPEHEMLDGAHRYRNEVNIAAPRGFDITNLGHVDALKREIVVAAPKSELADTLWNPPGDPQNAPVFVVDSLSAALVGKDENSNAVMSSAVAGLQRLARGAWRAHVDTDRYGAPREWDEQEPSNNLVLVLHHPAKGSTMPRGGGALAAGVDCILHMRRTRDGVSVQNVKARGFERGAVRHYRRRVEVARDFVHDRPDLSRVEFDEITPVAPKAAEPTPSAPIAEPETAPPSAASTPTVPEPPAHPAEALRGLPLAAWQCLMLGRGEALAVADAEARVCAAECFEGIEQRRRVERFRQVLEAWTKRGLVRDGAVMNPQ